MIQKLKSNMDSITRYPELHTLNNANCVINVSGVEGKL